MPNDASSLQSLIGYDESLRELSQLLETDPQSAEDLVQDTWVVALQGVPRGCRDPRAWLKSVLRNIARSRWRSRVRRAEHERILARLLSCELNWDPDTVSAVRDKVRATVRELRPPYRDALRMRYLEGLMPREIAAATGKPVSTVKSHLQRGAEMLRERLSADFEDETSLHGSAWLLLSAFALTRDARPVPAAPAAGAGLATRILTAAVTLLSFAAVGSVWWLADGARSPRDVSLARDAAGSGELPKARTELVRAAVPGRESIATPSPPPAARTLRVTVEDEAGAPVHGFELFRVRNDNALERIAAGDGEVTVELAAEDWIASRNPVAPTFPAPTRGDVLGLAVRAPGHVSSSLRLISPTPGSAELAFVLSDGPRTLRGQVVDTSGAPIAGARLARFDQRFHSELADDGRLEIGCPQVVTTGETGEFTLDGLGEDPILVRVEHPDFMPRFFGDELRSIVMFRGVALEGTVCDSAGLPAASATVSVTPFDVPSFAPRRTTTDEFGRFRMHGLKVGPRHFVEVRSRDGSEIQQVELQVEPGCTDEHDFELAPVAQHELTILDHAGDPVAHRAFHAQSLAGARRVVSFSTDAHGRVHLDSDPRFATVLELTAYQESRAKLHPFPCTVLTLDPEVPRQDLRLPAANGVLEVHVVTNESHAGLRTRLRMRRRGSRKLSTAFLPPNGRIEQIPAGVYEVFLELHQHGLLPLESAVDLTCPGRPARLEVRVPNLGRVVCEDSTPGRELRLEPCAASDGSASLTSSFQNGQAELTVLPGGYRAFLMNGFKVIAEEQVAVEPDCDLVLRFDG